VLLAITGWLVRSLITQLLSKDVEGFKTRLTTKAATDVAELTHRLQLIAVEHEKRTHLLQEKRAQTIERLYSRLVVFLGAAYRFSTPVELGEPPSKEEKIKELNKAAADFRGFFLRKRIYFTENVCKKIDELFGAVHNSASRYSMWTAYAENSDEAIPMMFEAWDAAWDVMKDKVPPLKSAIEHDFRTLLGVSV